MPQVPHSMPSTSPLCSSIEPISVRRRRISIWRHLHRDALALGQPVVGLPEVAVAVVLLDVDDVVVHAFLQAQAEALDALGDHRGRPISVGRARPRRPPPAPRAARARPRPRRRHALGRGALGQREDRLHRLAGGVDEGVQLLAVGVVVGIGRSATPESAAAWPPPARSSSSAAGRRALGIRYSGPKLSVAPACRPPPPPRSARPAPARRSRAPRRSPSSVTVVAPQSSAPRKM